MDEKITHRDDPQKNNKEDNTCDETVKDNVIFPDTPIWIPLRKLPFSIKAFLIILFVLLAIGLVKSVI